MQNNLGFGREKEDNHCFDKNSFYKFKSEYKLGAQPAQKSALNKENLVKSGVS